MTKTTALNTVACPYTKTPKGHFGASLFYLIVIFIYCIRPLLPIPVAARSKAIYSRSPAATVGSNPTEDMDVCLLRVVCCQVQVSATG